jgi:glyoxylase-like metal-dependent hydrolase (beta-lactamase superfamily II)
MEEIAFGPVRFIPGQNRGRYPYCNSVYIEGAGLLIDPASDRERLIRLRDEQGVRMVWLSHWHEDHFMHLDLFNGVPLWMSAQDAPPLADLSTFLDWYGFTAEEQLFWRPFLLDQFHFRPRRPERFLSGGETLDIGPLTVDVMATPGHTPGHLAFWFREISLLYTGDYDLTRFGPWYGDVHSDIGQTRASIDLLQRISARIILTGHEEGVFEHPSDALWNSYREVIAERERKLLAVLDEPKTLEAIVESWIVYGKPRTPKEFFAFGERAHMKKHLEELLSRGMITLENQSYRKAAASN